MWDQLAAYIAIAAKLRQDQSDIRSIWCPTKAEESLLNCLANLFSEEVTHDFVELDISEICGARTWPSSDRYPSLEVYCSLMETDGTVSVSENLSEIPYLFENSLVAARKPWSTHLRPRVAKLTDNSIWWSEEVEPRMLAGLIQTCRRLRVGFVFEARLVFVKANRAAIQQLSNHWTLLLCSRRVRDAVECVCEKNRVPFSSLAVPVFPRSNMHGFDAELVSFRDESYWVNDYLIGFLNSHSQTPSLRAELARRTDAFNFSNYILDFAG